MTARQEGAVAASLRNALRKPGLDTWLPRLAREAGLPQVRAIAQEALIFQRSKWLTRYDREWIDRPFGFKRRIARFAERPLEQACDRESQIAQAARDPAVAVRKVATRALIDFRHELSAKMVAVAKGLTDDKSATVSSRARFFLEKQGQS